MKLQPLYDLQQEINRLFIAGSKFAKGDPRLLKHVPVFSKLGEKAPVFKKLAGDIEELANTDSLQSSEKLSNLGILLYSILYTQGETTEESVEQTALNPEFNLDELKTERSYLQLKPVIEALTISNSGRYEIVKDALQQGVFKDFRTFQYLNIALGDKFSELADYVEKEVIPEVGKPMIPFILKSFEYDDKTPNVRRIRALNNIGFSGIPEMTEKILAESLPNMQAEVINILSNNIKNEDLIIKLADDKNRVVRDAANVALANFNTEKSLAKLIDVYKKNKTKGNLPGIVFALAQSRLPFFFQEVFTKINETFQAVLNAENDKALSSAFSNLTDELPILENKDREESYGMILEIVSNKKFAEIIKSKQAVIGYGWDYTHYIIRILNSYDTKKLINFYPTLIEKTISKEFTKKFREEFFNYCAGENFSKEKMFDMFHEYFPSEGVRIYQVYSLCYQEDAFQYEKNIDTSLLDKRWFDLLYKIAEKTKPENNGNYDSLIVLLSNYDKKSEKLNKLLVEHTEKSEPYASPFLFKKLMEREVSGRFEIIYNKIKSYTKKASISNRYMINNRLPENDFWTEFPKEYAEKFRELTAVAGKEIKGFDIIAEKIENK